MAKKAELIEEVAKLKLEVSPKATIAELEAAIAAAKPEKREKVEKEIVAERKSDVAKSGKRSGDHRANLFAAKVRNGKARMREPRQHGHS